MRVGIIGSEVLNWDISQYIPKETTEIISGGAQGIGKKAEMYADRYNIPKLVLKPDYIKYGKSATFRRNETIIDISDFIVAIWDGKSPGTKFGIDYAKKTGKPIKVIIMST